MGKSEFLKTIASRRLPGGLRGGLHQSMGCHGASGPGPRECHPACHQTARTAQILERSQHAHSQTHRRRQIAARHRGLIGGGTRPWATGKNGDTRHPIRPASGRQIQEAAAARDRRGSGTRLARACGARALAARRPRHSKGKIKVLFAGSSEAALREMFSRAAAPFYNWAPVEPFHSSAGSSSRPWSSSSPRWRSIPSS